MLMSSAGLSPAVWMEKHDVELPLIVSLPDLKACVENKTEWGHVTKELKSVCATHCGRRIFGDKLAKLADKELSKQMQTIIGNLDGEPITAKVIKDVVNTLEAVAKEKGKDIYDSGSCASQITYTYLGMQCTAKVYSLHQEAMIRIYAKAKGRGVQTGALQPLWCEKELLPEAKVVPAIRGVDADVLKDCGVARKAAHQLLETGSGSEIQKMLTTKNKLLHGLDRWWQVDRDFWMSVIGPPGEQRLRDLVKGAPTFCLSDASPIHGSLAENCRCGGLIASSRNRGNCDEHANQMLHLSHVLVRDHRPCRCSVGR
jgi:hypothetical protein